MPLDKKIKQILRETEMGLISVFGNLSNNQNTSFDSQRIIDITHKGTDNEEHHVATIYLGERYAEFYGEFIQTAATIPEFKGLVNYLKKNKWDSNLS